PAARMDSDVAGAGRRGAPPIGTGPLLVRVAGIAAPRADDPRLAETDARARGLRRMGSGSTGSGACRVSLARRTGPSRSRVRESPVSDLGDGHSAARRGSQHA